MINPPTHGAPRDAGDRLNGRSHGDSLPYAGGRGPASSPLWFSAARVRCGG